MRRVQELAALLCAAGAVLFFAAPGAPAQSPSLSSAPADPALAAQGHTLFRESCASCHGPDAQGRPNIAPSLRGVGALAADFYLRTGRMPLTDPHVQPRRTHQLLSDAKVRALVAYVGSLGGPPIPVVHPERGNLSQGMQLFTENCMGCHQALGRGGIVTQAYVPDLLSSNPTDVAEAVRIGPWVMPSFAGQFSDHQLDSLARYVAYTHHPDDVGGWGIGHIGPIPEGMVAWLLAAAALVLTARLLGERTQG
ncbi:MAG: c-type cytochrome [Solirubrobacteraceae bacterium]|nr:c-type cytochrome [Solirubrobacteraceae bacterium]